MILPRSTVILVLALLTVVSAWLSHRMADREPLAEVSPPANVPDTHMRDLVTITMGEDGWAKNKLYADTMAHYSDDTTKLTNPKLEIFQPDRRQTTITAGQGWVAADNSVIVLKDDTRLTQLDAAGEMTFDVTTHKVRVLVDQSFAETDQPVTIHTRKVALQSTGMKLHFESNRLVLLSDVQTTIPAHQAPVARP